MEHREEVISLSFLIVVMTDPRVSFNSLSHPVLSHLRRCRFSSWKLLFSLHFHNVNCESRTKCFYIKPRNEFCPLESLSPNFGNFPCCLSGESCLCLGEGSLANLYITIPFCTQKMKANKTTNGQEYQTTGEEKTSNQRVALIQLHTIKSLYNKNN
jgi:hypothetical protein